MALALPACAINPPPEVTSENRCDFRRLALNVPLPGENIASSSSEFVRALQESLYSGPRREGVSNSLLFLSGGSQEGAFGAGFLDGWSVLRTSDVAGRAAAGLRPATGLPQFRVVTAISTGAILSTWAFINRTGHPAMRYRIAR
ncbi:MAG TPA: hypothetical protein VF577_05925, partial [Allosphingosinicella sp.]